MSEVDSNRVVKYDWPGIPELTIKSEKVTIKLSSDSNLITWQNMIVEAVDSSGQKWRAESPAKIPDSWYK